MPHDTTLNVGANLPSKRVDGNYLYEIAPNRWVSRQRVWQLRKERARCCNVCGKPARSSNVRVCEEHRIAHNALDRAWCKRQKLAKRHTSTTATTETAL